VHRFEGTINQYTGDGIMALFGAPITHEDHAHRACYAALHLSDALRRYAEDLKRTQGLNFAVRMGMNSGEVIVGKIGDDLRMDYTAQGHTVGLAARLEQLADPGKAYVSEHTAGLASGFFRMRDLGPFDLKGVRGPLHVYELAGVGEMRTRLDVSRARGLSHFVGRSDEMDLLEKALARTVEGKAQVVGVVAEAGVGKSRLCFEFAERCRTRGMTVREGHGVPHGKFIPLLPVLEFMRGYFGVGDPDPPEEARRKIAGTLLLLDEAFREMLPILFEFLGVPDPRATAPKMDPEARQRQLFKIVKRLVRAQSDRQSSVILIEDLHWIDSGSEAFLENLVEALQGTRTLLLLNFRPEYHSGWMQKSYYRQLPLLPLGPAEIGELLDHLLGQDPSLAGLAGRIQEHTAGNPFFLEEVILSLVEGGILEGSPGAYRLAGTVERIAIPASVQALLAARMDRLPEREKQVLQTAAVVGKEFSDAVLKAVTDLPEADLAESLRALTAAEFIYQESLYPELEYAFKHPLTQDVAYQSQLADRRARVHGMVARAITEIYPEKLDERAALVAHHWEQAGESHEAAQWHYRAAEWAGLRDPAEALHHWRKMKELLDTLPDSPEIAALNLVARVQILNFGWRLGMPEDEAARLFAESEALAGRHGFVKAQAVLTFAYSAVRSLAGAGEEAIRLGREAARMAAETDDLGLKIGTLGTLAFTTWMEGHLQESLTLIEQALAEPPDDPKAGAEMTGFSPYVQSFFVRGLICVMLTRYEEARRSLDRAVVLAEEHGEMEILGWAQGGYVNLAQGTGNLEGALSHARQAVEIAEKTGSSFSRVLALQLLGAAHLLHGQWRESLEASTWALEIARESKTALSLEGRLLSYLAEAHLGAGDPILALEAANEAVGTIGRRGGRVYDCSTYLSHARVLMRTEGDRSRAAVGRDLADAWRSASETGATCWFPFIHLARAELAHLLGDESTGERELHEAHRLFTEAGATGHAARLTKELRK
jgi:adenylate cyclase